MTVRDKVKLIELLERFDKEELDCDGNCYTCYYCMDSHNYALDNCPLLVARTMIANKFEGKEKWAK
jgi:hypothetical protein